MTMKGIDISDYQRGLDLGAIDYDFVFCKATEGTNIINNTCDPFIQKAIGMGKLWGFYHFMGKADPIAQADFFYENCKNYFGRGVPMLALCAAMAGGLLALLSSVIAASTVYLVLVALSGLSAVVVWIAIAYCQIVFRRRWLESGHSTSELKYRTPGYPYVSWAAFILCTASFVLVIFDVEQRFALVAELVFIVACYGAYFLQQWVRKRKKATEADDLDTLWVARD